MVTSLGCCWPLAAPSPIPAWLPFAVGTSALSSHFGGWGAAGPCGRAVVPGVWAGSPRRAPRPATFSSGRLQSPGPWTGRTPGRNSGDAPARSARQLEVLLAPESSPAGLQLAEYLGLTVTSPFALSASQAQGGAVLGRLCEHSWVSHPRLRSDYTPNWLAAAWGDPHPHRGHSWSRLTHLLRLAAGAQGPCRQAHRARQKPSFRGLAGGRQPVRSCRVSAASTRV